MAWAHETVLQCCSAAELQCCSVPSTADTCPDNEAALFPRSAVLGTNNYGDQCQSNPSFNGTFTAATRLKKVFEYN